MPASQAEYGFSPFVVCGWKKWCHSRSFCKNFGVCSYPHTIAVYFAIIKDRYTQCNKNQMLEAF